LYIEREDTVGKSSPRDNNVPLARPVIAQLAIDYDMPQELANKLVGADEAETAANIQAMVDYLRSVIAAHNAYYDENGYPMKGEWKPRRIVKTGNEEAA
jgi:hypothetical protein